MNATVEQAIADFNERPSPYFASRLNGIAATNPDAWQSVRPTQRAELVADQIGNLPHGTRRRADAAAPVRAGATGSGDDLLVLTWTEADLDREKAAGRRLLEAAGVDSTMRVANGLPGALHSPGSLLLGDVVDGLGALDIPLGAVRDEKSAASAWVLIDRVEPNVLVLDGPAGEHLFAHAPAVERPWLQGLIWLRRDIDAPPPTIAFDGWQRTWLAIPEASSFVAVDCEQGYFRADDDVLVEVADGGNLLITPLGRDNPVVRYESQLRGRLFESDSGIPGTLFTLAD